MIINPARDSLNKKTTTNVDNNKEVKKNPTTNASDTIKTVKSNPIKTKSTMLSSQTPTVMTKKTIEETKKGTENYAKQVQQQYKANIEQKANDRIEFNTANAMEHIDSINNDLTGETFFKYYNEDGTFKDNKATRDEKVKLRDEKKVQLLKNNQEFKPSSTNLAFNNAPNFINYNAEQQKLSDEIKQLDSEIDELDYVIEGQDAINEMAQTDYINKNGTAEEKEKYKKFLSAYNDTYLERLANAYGASVIDTINIPVQAVEILKTVGERNLEDGFDFTDKDSLSTYLTNQSNELRSYVFNGSEGFENWSLQTLSSLMPMMNSMLIGMGLGTIAGASGQALTNFTNTFTNVTLGVQNAGQVTRQRIEEGNDLVTSFWNGVIHGTISGLVEGADAGRVASIFTGDASKFLLGTALLSKAKPTEILGFLNAVGASEGAEEIIEAYADRIADDMQNAITGSSLQTEQINPSDLASQFVMAYAGALLMGAPTAFNVAIDSKAKFNGAMEARNYFMSAIDSSLTTQEEKQAYATIVQSIDNEINNYKAKASPIQDAVSFSTDEVASLGSFNEAMQILANGLRSDIQEQVAMAEQSIQKASDLQNQFQSALNGRGININANDYLNLNEQAKQNVKDVQNYGQELGVNLGFDSSIAEDGYYDSNSKMIIINPNSKLGELSTLVHEITHGTEGSKFYDSLAQIIKENYDGDINNEINRIKKLYANYNVNLDNVGAEKEFVAKQTQNQLGNEEFVKMLVRYNNSLAYRLYRNIKGMADGDVKTQLENNFMKAFRENASDNGNIKFSITNMETTDEELSELKKIDLPGKEYKEIESAINSYPDIEKGLHYITMQGNYARGRYFFTTNGEYGSFTIVGKGDGQNIHRNNQPGWRRGVGSISLQSNENERAVRGNDELVSREQGNETNERLSSDKGFENPQFSISELEDKAIQEFGTTTNPYKAGFILPSGKMLDLSEGQNRRAQDHRIVRVLFDNLDYGRDGMSAGMIRFMNEGNIRLQPEGEGIDISNVVEPTNEQYSAIYDYYSTFRNDGFILDISDNNGDSVFSMEYAPGTSPREAINDIKNYFNNGTIPKDTGLNATEREMARFFYGDRFQYSIPDDEYYDYGTKPVREVDILKETKYGPTSQATRTIANSQFVNKRTAKQMARDVKEGVYAYDETTNKADTEKAVSRIKELGYDNAIDEVMKNNNIDDAKVTVAMGRELIKEMERRGETKTKRFIDLSSRITYMGSMLGQGVQAYATFKTMTPQGQLITIQDDVNRIQEELKQRYGDRAPNISLDESLIEEYRNAKTQEQRDEVALKMAKAIADQVPPTIEEQLNSYRHLSMLFNPRTWIKNALSNTVWGYVSDVKRAVQTSIEGIASMNNENFERHAGVYNPFSSQDKAWYKKLVNDYNNNFKGFQGKYTSGDVGDIISKSNFGQLVQDNRKQFKSEFLNKVSDINSKMMSDAPAMRKAYAKTFIGYLKSNNLTLDNISQEQYDYIKEYSFNKAREITFNAENKLANDISNFANKGGKVRKIVVDSFIPFKRTPLNILAQGAKYTPLQLGKTIAYDLKQLKSGKITGTQFVDGLASGLTGTGIVMLGALLASMGVFRTGDDDKDRKKSFDEDNGEQDYAIVFDGGTYTIDWLDPLIMPLSIGAELVNNENIDDKDLIDIASSIFDPVFETSMLSGITNNLNSYSSEGYVWKLVQNIGSNYASQYIPTIGGAIARTLDGTRRTTYPNDGFVDKFIKQTLNKIPGASILNQPYINKQGEEEKSEDLGFGVIGRAILNFLSPGYYSSNDIDKYDEELYRLYDETGEIDALPSSSSTSLTYNKENYKFTDEQYTEWHKVRWATEKKYVDEFIDSAKYKTLSDEERVATIKDIRTYAQQLAKKDFLESQGIEYNDSTYEKTQGALNAGIDIYEYFDYKNNAGKKQAEKVEYLKNSNLSNSQKEYLYGLEGYKTSYLEAYEKVMNKKKGITKQIMVQNKPISRNKKVVDKTVKVVKKTLPNGLKNASKTNQESYKQAYSRVLNRKRNK